MDDQGAALLKGNSVLIPIRMSLSMEDPFSVVPPAAAEKADPTTIQTLIFDKDKFKSVADAKAWARDHDFKAPEVDETEDSYRLRQKEPGTFAEGSMRTITLKPGVKAVIGRLKKRDGDAACYYCGSAMTKAEAAEVWWCARCGASVVGNPAPPLAGEVAKQTSGENVAKVVPLIKADEERYALGVVLVPEEVDSQGDIYSDVEVKQAAHRFMEEYQTVGLMHREKAEQVRIVESFVAPADFQVGDNAIKKGTWLLGLHVTDDAVWKAVKAGELTGLSIGGSAVRYPSTDPDKIPTQAGDAA